MDRTARRRDGGFTLLETLVAFAILALTLGPGYAVLSSSITAADRAEERLAALALAENALARVGAEIPLAEGVFREGALEIEMSRHHPADEPVWASIGARPYLVEVLVRGADGGVDARLSTLRLGPVR